ncbi:MAG TPA: 16S rRNA (cytosine(967)-C(5))-methyltransferase RsmB [Terriglobia bacterium]|nr:16S rRNA (cytosine(967)-C(5))-methyltransferase RsmB [Terriglobia bacterium]
MPVSPARKIAYQVLLRIESGPAFAVDLLQAPQVYDLKEADRRLATEIVMGVLRWQGELDFQIERASGKSVKRFDSEVATILRMGLYQIRFLQKIPKRAVVDDAVELVKMARKRSASGLMNAVLRKCEASEGSPLSRTYDLLSAEWRESVRRAFPPWLLERWERNASGAGNEAAMAMAFASLLTPPTTLRVADSDANLENMQKELQAEGVATSPGRYAPRALGVDSGHIQNSRAYLEGRVAIQDEASQLVAGLVAPEPGQRVLDLCAAPGMKAGQVAQMLVAGTLVACDRSAPRLHTLSRLLPRRVPAGVHTSLVRLDAAQELPFAIKFDRILLDAPCSGTGTLARNPEIKRRLRAEDIKRLADLQVRMLRNALPALAPGGQLVYATCSLEPEENERVVQKVLNDLPAFQMFSPRELALKYPTLISLFDSGGYFRTRPDQHRLDGFCAAVMVRRQRE